MCGLYENFAPSCIFVTFEGYAKKRLKKNIFQAGFGLLLMMSKSEQSR